MTPIPLSTVEALNRPHRNLLLYYGLMALLSGPFFPIVMLPLYFRYHTLHYTFDDEGVSMRWGILFRREISLTYARLQDIHLQSNLLERWLGLARVKLQTASGSSSAEMTIEGLQQFQEVRDFLYSRMRGARARAQRAHGRDHALEAGAGATASATYAATRAPEASATSAELGAVIDALHGIASELQAIRSHLQTTPIRLEDERELERGTGTVRRDRARAEAGE
jgi:putative membrane protein